jgi:hypothetical protein
MSFILLNPAAEQKRQAGETKGPVSKSKYFEN